MDFLPFIICMTGVLAGALLGVSFSLKKIQYGRVFKERHRKRTRDEEHVEVTLLERMNNQDYAKSAYEENDRSVREKQKREDSAYQFLKRNRKNSRR